MAAEIKEELEIPKSKIKTIKLGSIFKQESPKYRKTWIVHPVLVEVTTDQVKLDWEAEAYQWTTLSAVKKLKLLPGFGLVLKNLSPYL